MARQFADSGDNMQKTTPTGIVVANAWSLGFWLQRDATVDSQGLIRIGASGARGVRFELNFVSSTTLRLRAVNENGGAGGNGATAFVTGAWRRIGFTHNGAGSVPLILDGSVDATVSMGTPTELNAGDKFEFGFTASGGTWTRARIAWPFFIQGVQLSATALDNYLNQTGGKTICSVDDDYGVGGFITADALKFLGPMQSGDPGDDISGVVNDLTDTATANIGDPAGLPADCAGGSASPLSLLNRGLGLGLERGLIHS